MHTPSCPCHTCQSRRLAARATISESEEVELAMELLGVSNEAEWEQFLGKLFKGIGRGLKKVGSVLKPLGGALKGLAKAALPMVGGALGSFIPIPGVGTAIGTALGSAVSKALEMEFGEMEAEEAEFEIARRFVRVAASAAHQAGDAAPGTPPLAAVREALLAAARAHVPGFAANEAELMGEAEAEAAYEGENQGEYQGEFEFQGEAASGRPMSGRWHRRGGHIVVLGI
ncbi:hypothetical protein [Variovorax sp. GT1P44]|uniref:hypothetical protein n=1 Tax=Variovorax sp. GT1P44 TaxID=3443742 RepID=UPI003F46715D